MGGCADAIMSKFAEVGFMDNRLGTESPNAKCIIQT